MKSAKRYLATLFAGLLVAVGLAFTATPAQASPADGNYAQCQVGTTVQDWTGKDPRDCTTGTYALLENWTVVLQIQPGQRDVWEEIKQGYEAAQAWCSNNSLTCTVVTGIGVALVSPLLVAQS
ncbi:hypothetical protein ACWGQ2_12580 [Arthrobacter sp. NPDC055585]